MASESKPEVLSLASSFRENSHDKYGTRFPDVRHVSNEEYSLDCRDDPIPPRIVSQERGCDPTERIGEQVWQRRAEGHHQQNPLSYSDGISAYGLSRSQERSCISESPFLKNSSYHLSEQDVWSTEAHAISGRPSSTAELPRSVSRNLMSRSEYVPESSFHLYRASFDRPEDQSPYGSMRLQPSLYENPESYEAPYAEKPPQERYKDYAIIRVPVPDVYSSGSAANSYTGLNYIWHQTLRIK
ncbi:hypothetical protein P170DRAFT_428921 [Aspergillus steynii IBT 23096]|uniref:Uncharacterized protein n=1 Tax=Aspergillus steynii IBT 23096 TaxID=1392250 RepID=A0A2I2FYL1_9EURO|nr:uncharacterized protein P170DRAFT_428921 [Aspergillus steynii IBT 23096]PLB45724.1 hypothetical protein P170DRAFT_428921 [Aspergillus steynii IBT 23096]